jgi:hypothetical protein
MGLGEIFFRTCLKQARIPLSYIRDLFDKDYPTRNGAGEEIEPRSLQQAIDTWLFTQITQAIRTFTTV